MSQSAPVRSLHRNGGTSAAAEDSRTVSLLTATVTAVTEDSLFLRLADGRSEPGWRAVGCLIEPVEGDVVLCAPVETGIAVLNVLTRNSPAEATLSVAGTDTLTLAQDTVSIRSGDLTVDSATVTVRAGSSRLIGKAITAIADGLETVVKQLRRVADQEISSVNDSVRVVHNTETLKAKHLTHEADQTMALRSHVTVIDASGDVRVNGERISLG